MVRLIEDPSLLYAGVGVALNDAMADMRARIVEKEPRGPGQLVASYSSTDPSVEADRNWHTWLLSGVVYARPVERGAWMRNARGPHMHGNFIIRDTFRALFAKSMASKLGQPTKLRTSTRRGPKLPAYPKNVLTGR